ncbi:MAG: PepSY domain-containing protein [Spirulina sp. SIO3F2]|nr:PepSY domain-containing protein [Spirulina sp. SIO3F2]
MNRKLLRSLHRTIAPFVMLPLVITILTGVTYRLGKSWFGLTRDQVHWLMVIHEGEYLGKFLEPFYVLLNGLGALFMLTTGISIWVSTWKPRANANQTPVSEPQTPTVGE